MPTFDTHYYKWEGKIRKQEKGGPIGLRAEGSLAKAVMAIFMAQLRKKLEELGMKVILLKSYVDDVLVVTRNVHLGTKYDRETKTLRSTEEDRERHEAEGKTRDNITMGIITEVANETLEFLEFTGEHSQGSQNPVPVLDAQAWFGKTPEENKWYDDPGSPGEETITPGHTIMYKFYKKPMASELSILGRSACPEGTKVSTAVAEVLRRWKNSSPLLPREESEMITIKYMDELCGMGYSQKWRENILQSALRGYKKICKKSDRNRSGI